MPIIRSAIKKMRKDKKRTAMNKSFKQKVKDQIKKAGKNVKSLDLAFSLIDKGVKKKLLQKNTAARIKSRISKITRKKTTDKKLSKKK